MGPKPTQKFFGEIRKFLDPPSSSEGAMVGTGMGKKIGVETCAIAHFFGLPE